MDHVRFEYQFPMLPVDVTHERFGIDHNRCILCTRCVRVCDEIEGAHTWDVAGRGTKSRVITDLNQPWGDVGHLHLVRQVRAGLPDRAPSSARARRWPRWNTTGRMLQFLVTAREKKQWLV